MSVWDCLILQQFPELSFVLIGPQAFKNGALNQAKLKSSLLGSPPKTWNSGGLFQSSISLPKEELQGGWAFPPKQELCWLEEGADMVEIKLLFKLFISVYLFLALRLSTGVWSSHEGFLDHMLLSQFFSEVVRSRGFYSAILSMSKNNF